MHAHQLDEAAQFFLHAWASLTDEQKDLLESAYEECGLGVEDTELPPWRYGASPMAIGYTLAIDSYREAFECPVSVDAARAVLLNYIEEYTEVIDVVE